MRIGLTVCILIIFAGTAPAQPITVPSLGPRFKQTRERVDTLFGPRDASRPPPDPQLNLFRAPSEAAIPRTAPRTRAPVNHAASDEFVLQEALAVLKKGGGGIVMLGDRTRLTFNQKIYRDGDYLVVQVRGSVIRLKIVLITSNSVTLALNESETVWRF